MAGKVWKISICTVSYTHLYANASYEVTAETPASDGSPKTVQLSIRPLNILKDNYDAIQVYVHSFNEKNADFSYADLTEEAYYDTCLLYTSRCV